MQSVFLLLFFSRQNLFFQFLRLTCNSIFRVEEYITSGRDKTIVDPEPTGLYTKRKQQIADSLNTDPVAKVDVVNYPESGWGKSLEKMPMFTRAEMNEHIARSGKKIGNIHRHSVPTTLRKQRRFLKINIFTKSWQPVMNTAFISKQNAATVTGKTTRRIS